MTVLSSQLCFTQRSFFIKRNKTKKVCIMLIFILMFYRLSSEWRCVTVTTGKNNIHYLVWSLFTYHSIEIMCFFVVENRDIEHNLYISFFKFVFHILIPNVISNQLVKWIWHIFKKITKSHYYFFYLFIFFLQIIV